MKKCCKLKSIYIFLVCNFINNKSRKKKYIFCVNKKTKAKLNLKIK